MGKIIEDPLAHLLCVNAVKRSTRRGKGKLYTKYAVIESEAEFASKDQRPSYSDSLLSKVWVIVNIAFLLDLPLFCDHNCIPSRKKSLSISRQGFQKVVSGPKCTRLK